MILHAREKLQALEVIYISKRREGATSVIFSFRRDHRRSHPAMKYLV
jgi:hypothetical protein